MNFIGIAHLALGLCKNIYGFIFPKSRFDNIFMTGFAAIPLSWLLCKGDRHFDHSDVSDLFENKKLYNFYSHCTTFLYIGSVIIVNKRSNLVPNKVLYSSIIMLLLYFYFVDLRTFFPFQITLGYLLHKIMYYSNYEFYILTEIFKYQISLLEKK